MSTGVEICIYPRTEEFSAEDTFLKLAESLDQPDLLQNGWGGFYVYKKKSALNGLPSNEQKYLIKNCYTNEERKEKLKECLIKNELVKCACLRFQAFTLLNQWEISNESNSPENEPIILELNTYDRGNYYGHLFRSEGHAKFYFEPASNYFVRYDSEFNLDPDYGEYNDCVLINLEILRKVLSRIVEALDPLSVKIFTGAGTYAPFNSHATYFANPEAFISDLNMIHDYWIGNFTPYYQAEPKPYKDCDPAKDVFQFNRMRSVEQREELWRAFNAWLIMLDEVTPDIVNDTWNVKQSVEDGGLDIQRTEQGGAFVFGSEHFFNSFISDVYLQALNIAYLENKEDIERQIKEIEDRRLE